MDPAKDRNFSINITFAILVAIGVIGATVAVFGFLWPLVQAKAPWPCLVLGASCVVALLIGLGRTLFLGGYHRGNDPGTNNKEF